MITDARHPGGERWLRANRLRIGLLVGVVETIAIVATDATWLLAVLLGAAALALYVLVGRRSRIEAVRDATWILAASQLVPVIIPVVVSAITFLLVMLIVVAALIAGAFLYVDRR